MQALARPASPVLRLSDRFVVDRRLLRPGAIVESVDVGRPGRPPVRIHILDTRETDDLAETMEAWAIAADAALPVAAHVATVTVDGLTCVVVDRLPIAPPRGASARASAVAEASVLAPALAERGVRVDRIPTAAIGVGPEGRLAFAAPPLGTAAPATADDPTAAEQAKVVVGRLAAISVDDEDASIVAGSEPALATPRPRRRGSTPRGAVVPGLDRERLREVARGRAIVRGALGLIILAIVLLALGNRGGSGLVPPTPLAGGVQQPATPIPSVAPPAPVRTTPSAPAARAPGRRRPGRASTSASPGRPRRRAGQAAEEAGAGRSRMRSTRVRKARRARAETEHRFSAEKTVPRTSRPTGAASSLPGTPPSRAVTPARPPSPRAPRGTARRRSPASSGGGGDPFGTL